MILPKYIYVLIFSFVIYRVQAQDSIYNRLIFHIYPLNFLVGDVPIGLEYHINNKLSNEIGLNVKCYEPQIFYKYNNGIKLQETIKLSLINKSKFQMKLEALLCYRNFYFQNKEDYWVERFPRDDLGSSDFVFSMDRKFTTLGGGVGIGFYTKIFRTINISFSAQGEYYYYTRHYTVKKVIKGDLSGYSDIVLPFNGSYGGKSWFPNILIRIGYEIY